MEDFAVFLENRLGFEQSIEAYFVANGYDIKKVKESSDHTSYYILTKNNEKVSALVKWSSSKVGEKAVRKTHNFATARGCRNSISITNSEFNEDSKQRAQSLNMKLMDKNTFSQLDKWKIDFTSFDIIPEFTGAVETPTVETDDIAEAYHSKQLSSGPSHTLSSYTY